MPKYYKFVNWISGKALKISQSLTLLIVIGLVIPFSGFLYALILSSPDAFSRSGSLLVSFAVLCVFVNHFYRGDLDLQEKVKDFYSYRGHPTSARNEVLKYNPGISEDEVKERVNKSMMQFHQMDHDVINMRYHHIALTTIEFLSALFGTLIWGFGDLVICLFL